MHTALVQNDVATLGRDDDGKPRTVIPPAQTQANLTERSRNLASVFGAALARGAMTRGELIADTGLSKATVSRMVDELGRLGLLVSTSTWGDDGGPATHSSCGIEPDPDDAASGVGIDPIDPDAPIAPVRGRRPTALTVPVAAGQVIGVSLGLQLTGVLAIDLAGRELSWSTLATPHHATVAEAVAWLGELITRARGPMPAPLHRVVIAVPARVVNGADVPHPPLSMSVLEGSAFAHELSAAIGAEVVLDSDANMALEGLTVEGLIPAGALPVLLNMSTVLTMALRRRDGSTAQGHSSSFGNFSLLPFGSPEGDSTLGALLSTNGLQAYCAERGIAISHISELWGGDGAAVRPDALPSEFALIHSVFSDALVSALRMIAVISDPLLVVLAGRLAPLAELVLPAVSRRLDAELDEPPQLLIASPHSRCHSTAHGSAHVALTHVQNVFCDRLAAGAPVHG